jgi:hypothetical protein
MYAMQGLSARERLWMLATTVISVVVAVLVRPLPGLEHVVGATGWTRAIEAVGFTLGQWFVLSLVGQLPFRLGLGPLTGERMSSARTQPAAAGLSAAERDELDAASRLVAEAQRAVSETRRDVRNLLRVVTEMRELMGRFEALEDRVLESRHDAKLRSPRAILDRIEALEAHLRLADEEHPDE